MTIIDALRDPNLLGGLPVFRDLSTWRTWCVFLACFYGLPLRSLDTVGVAEADAITLFRKHTGRTVYAPPPDGHKQGVVIVGRQAGKDRIGSAFQAYEAITATPEPDGTDLFSLSISQDSRASLRTQLAYARAAFRSDDVPLLKSLVTQERVDNLTLSTGVTLASYPCTPAAVRGIRARAVVLSELAYFRNSEGAPVDREMLRAVRPTLATTNGRLLILSSPYAPEGELHALHQQHFGRDDSTTLVWQASAPEMNPTLGHDYLTRMQQDDPEAYRSEVLGEFRQGVSTFLDADAIAASVETGTRERARVPGVAYVAFDDPASGSGSDAWTKAIAHRDGDRVVLDVLRTWTPPFNPSGVIAESADLSRAYGLNSTTGDRFAAGFVLEGFRVNGLTYTPSPLDRSGLYLELLPLMNAGRVRLLDLPDLLRELRGLERRRGSAGRDRIDHRPGQHDDRANAVAGALALAAGRDPAHVAATTKWALKESASEDNTRHQEHPMVASAGCPRP
ncbi:MAG: hypothetical protein ABS36_09400 [Acidobacteria bacterium SCN 69-37]|nr:MAG: hypothetical protein ABS36_09400 [Acidobacteria bacterium SCN 69-37]